MFADRSDVQGNIPQATEREKKGSVKGQSTNLPQRAFAAVEEFNRRHVRVEYGNVP